METLIALDHEVRIHEVRTKASQAKDKVERLAWEVEDLQRKSEALTVACQALWELLRSRTGLTDREILEKMQEIDFRDGRLDGKIGSTILRCPQCSRKNKSLRKTCLYCGCQLPTDHVFAKV